MSMDIIDMSAKAVHGRLMGVRPRGKTIVLPPEPEEMVDPAPHMIPGPFRWKAIAIEIAAEHVLTIGQLFSHRRARNITDARNHFWYRMLNETSMSMPQIAKLSGGFNHTAVGYGADIHRRKIGEPMQWLKTQRRYPKTHSAIL